MFTLSAADGIFFKLENQVLYFYDDYTYTGLVAKDNHDVIDMNRTWKWKIEKDEVFFINEKNQHGRFPTLDTRIIFAKIAEYYLLLDSETKKNSE